MATHCSKNNLNLQIQTWLGTAGVDATWLGTAGVDVTWLGTAGVDVTCMHIRV